jgi:hypothetical protein
MRTLKRIPNRHYHTSEVEIMTFWLVERANIRSEFTAEYERLWVCDWNTELEISAKQFPNVNLLGTYSFWTILLLLLLLLLKMYACKFIGSVENDDDHDHYEGLGLRLLTTVTKGPTVHAPGVCMSMKNHGGMISTEETF